MDDLIAQLRLHAELCEPSAKPLNRLLNETAAALAAAREDTARLDWLDTQRGDDVQGSYPEEPKLVGHYWSIDGQCTDVRTAIDAARKEARNG